MTGLGYNLNLFVRTKFAEIAYECDKQQKIKNQKNDKCNDGLLNGAEINLFKQKVKEKFNINFSFDNISQVTQHNVSIYDKERPKYGSSAMEIGQFFRSEKRVFEYYNNPNHESSDKWTNFGNSRKGITVMLTGNPNLSGNKDAMKKEIDRYFEESRKAVQAQE